MGNEDNKNFTPILPFDVTQGEHYYIYDHVTYTVDPAYCNKEAIRMESGNVYKYYRCATSEPFLIGDKK